MTSVDLIDDAILAAKLATAAGSILLELQRSPDLIGKALGQVGDKTSHEFLMAALKIARPQDAIRSEEADECRPAVAGSRLWIIDPLDGTREFSEGRDDWAIHVGLSIDGRPSAGAVALPGRKEVHTTHPKREPKPSAQRPRMVVSRSRASADCLKVADALGAEVIEMGSAGAKTMAIVRGDADVYLHSGGQYEWDSCAPSAVAAAHGLHISRVDGSPLTYAAADPWLPDLLICHPAWAHQVMMAWNQCSRTTTQGQPELNP